MSAVWRYLITDTRTGLIVREHLPLDVDQFSTGITGDQTLTAKIALTPETRDLDPDGATTPWRRIIWPLRDGQPQGAFIVTGRPGWSAGSSVLAIKAERADVIFKRRLIRDTLVFNGVDQLDIARDLLRYGTGQATLHTATQPASKGAAANLPWLVLDPTLSGVLRDRLDNQDGYQAARRMTIAEAIGNLVGLADGFEYRLDCSIDASTGLPIATWRPGYPRLGAPASNPSVTFEFPGAIQDLGLVEDGSSMATLCDVVSTGSGDQVLIGTAVNARPTDLGFPLLEDTFGADGVTAQATLDAKAADRLAARAGIDERWAVTLRAGAEPRLGTYVDGDHVGIRVKDPRWNATQERTLRIVGRTVIPSRGDRSEKVTLAVASQVED